MCKLNKHRHPTELVPKLCLGMHTPELCSGKQARSTMIVTTSAPTWFRNVNAEIPASAGMTRGLGILYF